MPDERRESLAWMAHESKDRQLPRLSVWNYDPCPVHERGWYDELGAQRFSPKPDCRNCAIIPRAHQRVGALWLYLRKKGLLADTTGVGKTTQAGLLIAMMIESGELDFVRDLSRGAKGRVLVVPTAPALAQWEAELHRMMPTLNIVVASGGMSAAQRRQMYLTPWQVLIMGPEMYRNDHERLRNLPLAALIVDDVDALRNPDTQTSVTLDNLGRRIDRYIIMNATPLQKRLMELHATLDAIGGERALGGRDTFERMYIDRRNGQLSYRRLDEVKRNMAPLVLRRTASDLDDVDMPRIQPLNHMLDLYPRQRDKYTELQRGVIRLLKENREQVKRVTAVSKLHYGAAICAGLGSLGADDIEDGPGMSVKHDWLMDRVNGEFEEDKIVVFARLKNTIRDLQFRLRDQRVGFTTIWGEDSSKEGRLAAQNRFRDDPNCRVLIGTSAIVRSLNLQVSRRLVNIDMIMNQAQMHQLAGRIARIGSMHRTVYVHNLLTVDTQEERYLPMLERESALAGHMWGEESELFEQLSPMAMLQLITG
jgi:SNF2 family DNA or RNA helicase